jgi:hypothetical protein
VPAPAAVDDSRVRLVPLDELPSRRALRALVAVRESLDALERELVRDARREGTPWHELGADLRLTGEGVRRRHAGRSRRGRPLWELLDGFVDDVLPPLPATPKRPARRTSRRTRPR